MKNTGDFSKFKEELSLAAQQVEEGDFDSIDQCIRAIVAIEKKYFYERDNSHGRINEIKDITNSEIPIYLLEKALEMSKNE